MGGWQSRARDGPGFRLYATIGCAGFVVALLMRVLSVRGIVGSLRAPYAEAIEQAFTVVMLLVFGYACKKLEEPSAAERAARQKQVDSVLADPAAQAQGETRVWYDAASEFCSNALRAAGVGLLGLLVAAVATAYPTPVTAAVGPALAALWQGLTARFTHWQIFVVGNWLAFTGLFWALGAIFAYIDFKRPALLVPFRVQPSRWPTASDYCAAARLALFNSAVLFFLFWGLYLLLPAFNPAAFSDDLPGLGETVVQLVYSMAVAEFLFFCTHALLHTKYLYAHIHSVHHRFMTPFSITAIAAHPIEFVFGNFVMFVGPFFCNAHVLLWLPATFFGCLVTCLNHSGYQIPVLIGPNQFHDYHHSHVPGPEGFQNYGILGFLDSLCRTNSFFELRSWQAKVDRIYWTPNMPIDRFIAQRAAPPTPEPLGDGEQALFVLGAAAEAEKAAPVPLEDATA